MSNIICGVLKKKKLFYFSYDRDSNILSIQPKKMKKHAGLSNFDSTNYSYFNGYVDLEGETNHRNYIKFINISFTSIGRGCFQAWVPAYIEGKSNGIYPIPKPNKINEIIFSGSAIDLFVQSNRIVKDNIDYDLKKLSINIDYGDDKIKSFVYNNYTYSFYPAWKRSVGKEINNVLIMNSHLCVNSTKYMKIKEILKCYELTEKFLCFANYRKHILFDKIILNQEEDIDFFGNIQKTKISFELHVSSSDATYDLAQDNKVILIDDVYDKIEYLFKNIINSDFLIQSLPFNENDKNIIDVDKYINVSSAFESEMSKMFSNFKAETNEKFKNIQKDICKYINFKIKQQKSKNSKETKYYENILKEIKNLDGRLDEKISYAMKKYSYIIEKDINYYKKLYNLENIIINDLAVAFSNKRNYLAHGYKLESFNKYEIMAYVMIEKICYALILERSGLTKERIEDIIQKIL